MVLCLLGQPLIVTVITIGMRKMPAESKLKIISKLNKMMLRNYFLLANNLYTFLSHLTTGATLFRYRKGTNPVSNLATAQHIWGSGQKCFLSRASVTHIHLSPGEYVFSQIHHCICALWLWLSILLVSFFGRPRNKVFLLLRLLLSPGSLMHWEYIPVVCDKAVWPWSRQLLCLVLRGNVPLLPFLPHMGGTISGNLYLR